MFLMGLFWGIRLRNLNFFSAVNPKMINGGLFNYSKFGALLDFKDENIPKSILSKPKHCILTLLEAARQKEISFPFILKPDIGERGRGVKLISNQLEAENYLIAFRNESIILQEFIPKDEEYGIFIIKNPKSGSLKIPSITQKIPLQVIGNGGQTVYQLAQRHPRAKRYLQEIPKEMMQSIPEPNCILRLSVKGNHCKGATFLDRSELITPEVTAAFEKICHPFHGFFYGRLDVKVDTSADLSIPSKVSIMEVNGTNSEPIHLYSSENSYFRSFSILADFFSEMAQIARFNLQSIHPKPTFSDLKRSFKSYRRIKKNTNE